MSRSEPLIERAGVYQHALHKECYGKVVVLYIFKDRKWLAVGEFCDRCGTVKLKPQILETLAEKNRRPIIW